MIDYIPESWRFIPFRVKRKKRVLGENSQMKTLLRLDPYCKYCRTLLTEKTATRDHVIPKSKGGLGTLDNIVLACAICNRKKDNKILTKRLKSDLFSNWC